MSYEQFEKRGMAFAMPQPLLAFNCDADQKECAMPRLN